ncbi:MAG: hypothetical protein KatS3mg112_1630 [Thermogutta sp.]|nr:MAG: hypothetical protein KatS3mg112_1630 [Thermogutta sp.]
MYRGFAGNGQEWEITQPAVTPSIALGVREPDAALPPGVKHRACRKTRFLGRPLRRALLDGV